MDKNKAISRFNHLAKNNTPFLFIIDYKMEDIDVLPLNEVNPDTILYQINDWHNIPLKTAPVGESKKEFTAHPISFDDYNESYQKVNNHLKQGNTYLTNLTAETPISSNYTLKEIFFKSKAKFKLWYKDQFVVFSPEIFVKICDQKIYSFPMKGTIDASLFNAHEEILQDHKETAEHATITDLIRNDLSMVATNVKVDDYRYIDTVKTHQGELLQVSSKISGELEKGYTQNLGDIFFKLLPAGSITGAPKPKTLDIIDEAETYHRGFYTGVMGIFDGQNLNSGVMIRFVEKRGEQLFFKSGGGVTINSEPKKEYQELMNKIYLPFGTA